MTMTNDLSGLASFADVLVSRADQYASRPAFSFLGATGEEVASLTFEQLCVRAQGVAVFLAAELPAASRVVLLYPPGPDYVVAVFGCFLGGFTAVPAYPPLDQKQLLQLSLTARDADPAGFLAPPGVREYVEGGLRGDDAIVGPRWLVAPDGVADPGTIRRSGPPPPALLQYTSGSTRRPRGVVVTHPNLLHSSEQIRRCFGHSEASRGVIWLPPYHDMGLVGGILQPVYAGFPVWLMSPLDFLHNPVGWLRAVARFGGTTSGGPNFAYDLCVRRTAEADRVGLDLSSWNVAFTGAETVRAGTLRDFAAAFAPYGFAPEAFLPCYGLAEATLLVAGWPRSRAPRVGRYDATALGTGRAVKATGDPSREVVSVGPAAPGQVIRVVDPDTGSVLPAGQVGEIRVRGPNVAAGYWNHRTETEATFGAVIGGSPYLRTGDLGFTDDEANLYVVGRSKDVLVVRGRNHAPDDLEATAAAAHPLLRVGCGACFTSAEDDRVVLVQEVRREPGDDEAYQIYANVREAVAATHQITLDTIVLVARGGVPKTSSGKVQRSRCRARLLAGDLPVLATSELTAGAGRAAETRRLVEAVLGVPLADVPGGTRLTALGMDSLRAAELRARLERDLGVTMPIHTLLTDATLDSVTAAPQNPASAPWSAGETTASSADTTGDGALTRGEESLWFLDEFREGGDSPTVVCHAVLVEGPLDTAAVRQTVDLLAERHAALRTRVGVEQGVVTRSVDTVSVGFDVVDASTWSAERLDAECRRRSAVPVSLAGPLWQLDLLRLAPDRHILLVRTHHLVVDLWSLEVLLADFGQTYPRIVGGQRPEVGDVDPDPMSREAQRERDLLASPRADRMWRYWQRQLDGAPGVLALPTDHERPERPSHRGAVVTGELDPEAGARLTALARRSDLSLPSLLLAAYGWLLHRYSGQSDLVVGSVYANRDRPDRAGVVGYLANLLPVRLRTTPGDTFRGYASRTHRTSCEAMDHGELPFPLIVERLRPEREAGRSPVFQALFAFQRATRGVGASTLALGGGDEAVRVGPLRLRPWPLPYRPALTDLALEASQVDDVVRLRLTYATDLFDADTARRLLDSLRHLVDRVSREPDQSYTDATHPGPAASGRLLTDWNGQPRDVPAGELLHHPFRSWAAERPDAAAVVDGDRTVSYGRLGVLTGRLAARLRGYGVGAEHRIGVCLPRSLEYVIAVLGVLRAGAAYVPLDPDLPPERLRDLCSLAGIDRVVTGDGPARDVARTLGADVVDLAAPEAEPVAPNRVGPDGVAPDHVEPDDAASDPLGLGYVMYTSGSTGEPKAVGVPHVAVANLLADFQHRGVVPAGARCAWWTSTGFDVSVYEIFSAFHAGGCVVVVPEEVRVDGAALARWMREQQIASAFVPPFALPEFVAELEQHGAPSLRRLLLGVEPIPEQLAKRLAAALPGTTVVNAYGPTEATVMCTAYQVDPAELAERRLPIGRAVGNLRAYVLDPYGRLLPQGAVGELCVGGVQLARGYLGRPAATAERFTPDPYAATPGERMYRTGDLVRYRVDGQLEFVGRVDHQVKLHGQRVELGEIGSVLARHPAVREAVAVVAGDGPRRHVVGYAVADRAGDPDELAREVLAAAARSLPRHMVPSRLHWLDHWPLSANGKVDRARLSAAVAPAGPKPRRTAGTPLERLVAAAFAQQLGLADVDPDDNFFELGGHSLAAARAVTQLRGLLHLELPVSAVFQYPTVTELAAYLQAAGGSAARPGIRRQPRGSASIAAMRSTVAGASNPEPPRQTRPAVPEEAR